MTQITESPAHTHHSTDAGVGNSSGFTVPKASAGPLCQRAAQAPRLRLYIVLVVAIIHAAMSRMNGMLLEFDGSQQGSYHT